MRLTGTRLCAGVVMVVVAVGLAGAGNDPVPYAGLPAEAEALFVEGLAQFEVAETPATGLGPVFNAENCAACHVRPTTGGSSTARVTRFGRAAPRGFDPLVGLGGPVIQAKGVAGPGCAVVGEVVPPEATVVASRDTPALFGAGLVDTIPDRRILRLADPNDQNHDGVSGRPNRVRGRVGRFGWKAQVVTLRQFTASAYLNEIGMTSPDFPNELAPQGAPVRCDQAPDPEDDGRRIDAVTRFLLLLAPLPRVDQPRTLAGRIVFRRIGCETCHTTRLRAGRAHPVRALRDRRVALFSDLLLHDLGPGLADGIAQGFASGSEFRTPPLWGVRESAPYLHDGRAATLEEAIALHGGEAARAVDRFLALEAKRRDALLAFLRAI